VFLKSVLTRDLVVSRETIVQLLRQAGFRQFLMHRSRARVEDDTTDESEPDTGYGGIAPRRGKRRGTAAFEKVPSDKGRELIEHGIFGTTYREEDTIQRKKRVAHQIMRRELGLGSTGRQKTANNFIAQVSKVAVRG
jgi:DDB1- and CUL4-associated factor 11